MKKMTRNLKIAVLIMMVGLVFSSCEKEKSQYQVRIQNDMYNELSVLGVSSPFMKYDIAEFKLGGLVFSDVSYGSYSDYQSIESSTDYEASVTVNMYLYDSENYVWKNDGTETFDLGTISWVDDEDYTNQKIKLQIGTLLELYKPVYSKYAEE